MKTSRINLSKNGEKWSWCVDLALKKHSLGHSVSLCVFLWNLKQKSDVDDQEDSDLVDLSVFEFSFVLHKEAKKKHSREIYQSRP